MKYVAEEVQHLGGLHIKLNSHPFRAKLPRQDCHRSKSIDRFDSLKAFLGGNHCHEEADEVAGRCWGHQFRPKNDEKPNTEAKH